MVFVDEMVYDNLRCILRVSKPGHANKGGAISTVSLDPHESLN